MRYPSKRWNYYPGFSLVQSHNHHENLDTETAINLINHNVYSNNNP